MPALVIMGVNASFLSRTNQRLQSFVSRHWVPKWYPHVMLTPAFNRWGEWSRRILDIQKLNQFVINLDLSVLIKFSIIYYWELGIFPRKEETQNLKLTPINEGTSRLCFVTCQRLKGKRILRCKALDGTPPRVGVAFAVSSSYGLPLLLLLLFFFLGKAFAPGAGLRRIPRRDLKCSSHVKIIRRRESIKGRSVLSFHRVETIIFLASGGGIFMGKRGAVRSMCMFRVRVHILVSVSRGWHSHLNLPSGMNAIREGWRRREGNKSITIKIEQWIQQTLARWNWPFVLWGDFSVLVDVNLFNLSCLLVEKWEKVYSLSLNNISYSYSYVGCT